MSQNAPPIVKSCTRTLTRCTLFDESASADPKIRTLSERVVPSAAHGTSKERLVFCTVTVRSVVSA
jgi:hypothetical protein